MTKILKRNLLVIYCDIRDFICKITITMPDNQNEPFQVSVRGTFYRASLFFVLDKFCFKRTFFFVAKTRIQGLIMASHDVMGIVPISASFFFFFFVQKLCKYCGMINDGLGICKFLHHIPKVLKY